MHRRYSAQDGFPSVFPLPPPVPPPPVPLHPFPLRPFPSIRSPSARSPPPFPLRPFPRPYRIPAQWYPFVSTRSTYDGFAEESRMMADVKNSSVDTHYLDDHDERACLHFFGFSLGDGCLGRIRDSVSRCSISPPPPCTASA